MRGFGESAKRFAGLALATGALGVGAAGASEVVDVNRFTMFNVIQCQSGSEAREALDARNFVERTGNPYVLMSLTLHPQGRPAMKTVDAVVASYRKWAQLLKGSPAKPGILLQAILGHWARVGGDEEPWQREIDQNGKVQRFCPLDAGFQAYIREVGAKLAGEHPSVIMSDDDVTSFHDGTTQCFCPLHLAEFNRRTGLSLDAGQFRQKIKAARPGDPELVAFEKLQAETILSVVRLLREGIDSVDPSVPGGSCMPYVSWERERVADYARALAGNHVPFVRTCNGQYVEGSAKYDFPHLMSLTLAYLDRLRDFPCLLDEADTFPHNLWAKSSRTMHAKMAAGAFAGLRGAKLWFVGGHKNRQPLARNYIDILERHRGYYDALVGVANGSSLCGAAIPCHRRFHEANPTGPLPGPATYDDKNWGERAFGSFGISFRMCERLGEDEKAVFAIAGAKAVERFGDDDLRTILSRKALVDGDAARALLARGFGPLIGIAARTGEPPKHKAEMLEATGEAVSLPLSCNPLSFTALPGPRTLASFVMYPASGALEEATATCDLTRVAPSATICRNALGGTVVVTAYWTLVYGYYLESEPRKRYVLSLLAELDPTVTENASADDQNVFVMARRSRSDGRTDFVFAANLNYDPLESLTFRRQGRPSSVARLDEHGVFRETSFDWKDGVLAVPAALACYEETVLRIRR